MIYCAIAATLAKHWSPDAEAQDDDLSNDTAPGRSRSCGNLVLESDLHRNQFKMIKKQKTFQNAEPCNAWVRSD